MLMRRAMAIGYRELLLVSRTYRSYIQAFSNPLLMLIIFAPTLDNLIPRVVAGGQSITYGAYVVPGLGVMVAFSTSHVAALAMVIDRLTGELETLFSMPFSRTTLLLARSSITSGLATLLAVIIYGIGIMITGVAPTLVSAVGIIIILFCFGHAASALFASLAAIDRQGGQGSLSLLNTITLPLFFTSSIYYPVEYIPLSLRWLAIVNPLSYPAAAVRSLWMGQWPTAITAVGMIAVYAVIMAASIRMYNLALRSG